MGVRKVMGLFSGTALLILVLFMAGCAGERPAAVAKRQGILIVGNGPEPVALDPHVTTGTAELNIQMNLFEGLVTPHPETLDPLPGVAASWEVSEDGLVYRFALRPEARWSDGHPVVADDFVAAWRRALHPDQGTPYATMLHLLRGGRAYNLEEISDPAQIGAAAIDPQVLEVTLDQPVPYFLQVLLHPVWYPVPSHLSTDLTERVGTWATPEGFVGNGPFVLKEWVPNQYVEVARNPVYWDANSVYLNGARFMAMDEPGAEERAYLAGQLHATDALPPARVAAYRDKHSQALRIDPYLGTYYILPNLREGVLSDPKVRRALALSIDRRALTERLLGAGQSPAGGLVPDTMPGYDANIPVEYDPHKARALLADAGYPGGKGFPQLEYLFNSSESHRQIAEALQSMWREQLGIEISLVNLEWRTYLQRRSSGDFQLARAVWIGDYLEPSTFLNLWTTGNPNNWAGWQSPSYDALLQSALRASSPENRMRSYALAERYLIAEQVVIPLYHYVTAYLLDPSVQGWHPNLLDWHPLKYVRFE